MISHIHGMSRDIALMERLGPNPKATMRWLQDGIQKEAHLPKYPGASGSTRPTRRRSGSTISTRS
jgi:hypothetical protein